MKLNLIEVTDIQNGSRIAINIANVHYFLKTGDRTLIVFSSHNMPVKESYEEIKSLLMQMV